MHPLDAPKEAIISGIFPETMIQPLLCPVLITRYYCFIARYSTNITTENTGSHRKNYPNHDKQVQNVRNHHVDVDVPIQKSIERVTKTTHAASNFWTNQGNQDWLKSHVFVVWLVQIHRI